MKDAGDSTIPIDVLTTAMPIVISVAEVAYIALGWKIYHEFGWKVYKFLGADRQLKKMYAIYQVYECLVKFDVFFWVGFSVQFIWLVLSDTKDTQVEYYITCAAIPFSLVLLVEGHLAARYENKWMMATFMLGCVGAMVYFVYKVRSHLFINGLWSNLDLSLSKSCFTCTKHLTKTYGSHYQRSVSYQLFTPLPDLTNCHEAVIALILLFATFVYSVLVLRNFGRGLKDACQ